MKTKQELEKDLKFEEYYAEKYGWKITWPYIQQIIEDLVCYPDEEVSPPGKVKALTVFEYKEGR